MSPQFSAAINQETWKQGRIIKVEDRDMRDQFWHHATSSLKQQLLDSSLLQPIDFGNSDNPDWYHSVMGHGSTNVGQSSTRPFSGTARQRMGIMCGWLQPFDGKQTSISWTVEICQISVSQGRGCIACRRIKCTLTAAVLPVHRGIKKGPPRISYRFTTKKLGTMRRPSFIHKEELPSLPSAGFYGCI